MRIRVFPGSCASVTRAYTDDIPSTERAQSSHALTETESDLIWEMTGLESKRMSL